LKRINKLTFIGLNELIMLDLDENPIEFIESNSFDTLVKLKQLSLNNNIKIIKLIQQPIFYSWFTSLITIKQQQQQQHDTSIDISLKSNTWLQDFCSIQDLFLRLNRIINDNQQQQRRLHLFNEDLIEASLSNINLYYCNIKFICMNFKNIYLKLDVYNMCDRINEIDYLKKSNCIFYRMSYECFLDGNFCIYLYLL
jgi:hypothetical protein